jgi:DNA-binding phage protein
MPLARDFVETVRERAQREPEYRRALLRTAIEILLSGEVDTGKVLLRRYINATIGFQRLGSELGKSEKSLMQMLSPAGNPQAKNLFGIIETLQRLEGVALGVVVNEREHAA